MCELAKKSQKKRIEEENQQEDTSDNEQDTGKSYSALRDPGPSASELSPCTNTTKSKVYPSNKATLPGSVTKSTVDEGSTLNYDNK